MKLSTLFWVALVMALLSLAIQGRQDVTFYWWAGVAGIALVAQAVIDEAERRVLEHLKGLAEARMNAMRAAKMEAT
jgi:hypothetical protein